MAILRTLKTGISGVRGIVGESLTPQLLIGFAQAFGTYLKGGTVVIGRDTRPSGELVRTSLVGGLLATGCDIVDVGVAPVPAIQMAVKEAHAVGGVAITASHNPQKWNALKFIRHDGVALHPHQVEELLSVYYQGKYSLATSDQIGSVVMDEGAVDRHLQAVVAAADVERIGGAGLKVVVDCVNGAGSVMVGRFLETLGCEVVTINDTPDGIFPHAPEPVRENLWQLEKSVNDHGADIGFAIDADADRLAIVSEKGEAIGEEFTLAFACDAMAGRSDGPLVTNISTSRMIDEVGARYGKKVIRTKVGEINVVLQMMRQKAGIGGEGNGGVIWPKVSYCRDSIAGMAIILAGLVERGGTVSDWVKTFAPSETCKSMMQCAVIRVQPALLTLADKYDGLNMDTTEGVKVTWPNGSWLHVRPSNTEAALRVIAEADTFDQAHDLVNDAMDIMRGHV